MPKDFTIIHTYTACETFTVYAENAEQAISFYEVGFSGKEGIELERDTDEYLSGLETVAIERT